MEGLLASGLLDPETGDLVAKLAEAKDLKIAFGSRELNQSHFILVDPESSTEAAAADQRKGQAQLMAAAGFNTGCMDLSDLCGGKWVFGLRSIIEGQFAL